MNAYLVGGAAGMVLIAALHSVLGEKYILERLFRRSDLPRLFGSDVFTRRTLRFAWHLTSIAWIGFGAVTLSLANQTPINAASAGVIEIVRWTFLITALVALFGSRGRHFAWVVFLAIAGALWVGTP